MTFLDIVVSHYIQWCGHALQDDLMEFKRSKDLQMGLFEKQKYQVSSRLLGEKMLSMLGVSGEQPDFEPRKTQK